MSYNKIDKCKLLIINELTILFRIIINVKKS